MEINLRFAGCRAVRWKLGSLVSFKPEQPEGKRSSCIVGSLCVRPHPDVAQSPGIVQYWSLPSRFSALMYMSFLFTHHLHASKIPVFTFCFHVGPYPRFPSSASNGTSPRTLPLCPGNGSPALQMRTLSWIL